ncbi:prevent-host-death protein [Candidatus Termititenax persephonae]|uniref:Prevent-host-death protein n=1 Tax=Candidatus Termititenax persephonae TaxID=2218525 RepID=A0A388TJV4_9BACT|nr:prevent-host-death protein [Candidatus Termititenax persephonae]
MKFITVRDFRTASARIWQTLPTEEEMIVTNNGKPIALLTPLSDATLENTVATVRRAKVLDAIKTLQQLSSRAGRDKMSLKEINRIISLTRQQ